MTTSVENAVKDGIIDSIPFEGRFGTMVGEMCKAATGKEEPSVTK